jgi:hypothetical protein
MKALIAAAALAVGMMAVTTGTAEARWHHHSGWGHHRHCTGWGWGHHHRRYCRGWGW